MDAQASVQGLEAEMARLSEVDATEGESRQVARHLQ